MTPEYAVINPIPKKTTLLFCAKSILFLPAALVCSLPLSTALADAFSNGVSAYDAKDYEAARTLWESAAADGNPEAAHNLGTLYTQGLGVENNLTEARRWYRMAAQQGHLDAQNKLAAILFSAKNAKEDQEEAIQWFRKAAEAGQIHAQNNLAVAYERGVGLAQDHQQALLWYERAGKAGHAGAQTRAGIYHYTGTSGSQNAAEAVKWFELAAAQGVTQAQYNLAICLAEGRGTHADPERAWRWFSKAAAKDHEPSQDALDTMITQLAQTIVVPSANIRAEASTSARRLALLKSGQKLIAFGSRDSWLRVYSPDEDAWGWIFERLVTSEVPN